MQTGILLWWVGYSHCCTSLCNTYFYFYICSYFCPHLYCSVLSYYLLENIKSHFSRKLFMVILSHHMSFFEHQSCWSIPHNLMTNHSFLVLSFFFLGVLSWCGGLTLTKMPESRGHNLCIFSISSPNCSMCGLAKPLLKINPCLLLWTYPLQCTLWDFWFLI